MTYPHGGAGQIWRDDDGYNPEKSEIRDWGGAVETIQADHAEHLDALDDATAYASLLRGMWSSLQQLTTAGDGQRAEVDDSDTGTHLDLTATGYDGASVPNAGTYSWSAAWNGWSRIGDTGLAGKVDQAALDAEITARSSLIDDDTNPVSLLQILHDGVTEVFGIDNLTGRARLRLSGFYGDALDEFGVTTKESGFPSIENIDGTKLLWFEEGMLNCALHSAVVRQVIAKESGFPSIENIDGTKLLWFEEGMLNCALHPAVARQVIDITGAPDQPASPDQAALVSGPDIVAWGDSLTQYRWPNDVQVLLNDGRTAYDGAKGGQHGLGIAIRAGVRPCLMSVAGDTIPATGGVAVTAKNNNFLTSAGSFTGSATIIYNDVEGLLTTDASGNWTFTRDVDGAAVSAPPNSEAWLTDTGTSFCLGNLTEKRSQLTIVWSGTNTDTPDVSNAAEFRAAVRRECGYVEDIVAALSPKVTNYIVFPPFASETNVAGTPTHIFKRAVAAEYSAIFGSHYFDLFDYVVNQAVYDAVNEGLIASVTQDDLTDMSNFIEPRSLRQDAVHPNNAGDAVVANIIARLIKSKGY